MTIIDTNDTICAMATPAGGAIGIVRISGTNAIDIANSLFAPKNKLVNARPSSLSYGRILDAQGQEIDDVLVSVFHAPHSYTGENSVEISCHGSRYIMTEILKALILSGCRQAEPGEFTKRAFLNGKMDLSQAEAVADLIASTNKATHTMAMSQLKGCFSEELKTLRAQLLKLNSLLELELDFSDHEELEFADRTELLDLVNRAESKISSLAKSFETGVALKHGIPVAIVGKTNVGKSSLLNILLHEDKAIVSDVHGTTRDTIEDSIDIDGVTFRFIDTAGIRQTTDTVEQIGITRTYNKISEASIVLWVVDQQPSEAEYSDMLQKCEGKKLIIVKNKCDIAPSFTISHTDIPNAEISAKANIGIDALTDLLIQVADIPQLTENSIIVNNIRHYEALTRALDHLSRVREAFDLGLSGDLISEDLKLVLIELGDITGGAISSQETLNNIFSHFCIGK